MPFCGKNAIQFPACVPQHQVSITEHDGIIYLGDNYPYAYYDHSHLESANFNLESFYIAKQIMK